MKITAQREGFVGWVSDADLSKAWDETEQQELRAALDAYTVLVFEGGAITDEDHLRLAGYLGRIRDRDGKPLLTTAGNVDSEGDIMAESDPRRWVAKGSRMWHTDLSFQPVPDLYGVLSTVEHPRSGGNTQFADTAAAWRALSGEMQATCRSLVGIHDFAHHRKSIGYSLSEAERQSYPPTPQPLVVRDNRSDREGLYLASHLGAIAGYDEAESTSLIENLVTHATKPEFVFEVDWAGDASLAVWDERFTMHRGTPYADTLERRRLRRCAVMLPGPLTEFAGAR